MSQSTTWQAASQNSSGAVNTPPCQPAPYTASPTTNHGSPATWKSTGSWIRDSASHHGPAVATVDSLGLKTPLPEKQYGDILPAIFVLSYLLDHRDGCARSRTLSMAQPPPAAATVDLETINHHHPEVSPIFSLWGVLWEFFISCYEGIRAGSVYSITTVYMFVCSSKVPWHNVIRYHFKWINVEAESIT